MVRMLVRAKVGLLVDHPSCRAVVVTQHVCHQALAAWPWPGRCHTSNAAIHRRTGQMAGELIDGSTWRSDQTPEIRTPQSG